MQKIDCKNEIYAKKLGKEHLDYKKSTLGKKSTVKVNRKSKSTLVNGPVNVLVNDDVADDVNGCLVDDVSR